MLYASHMINITPRSDSVSEVGANAPWEARAPDLEINRLTLWPAELRKPDARHPPQGTAITAMIPRLNFRALPAHFEDARPFR